ncbi:RNA pseudouridine synthase [Gammaproteobacteria bacterium 45_16_T64]|nr:RNA pseudouridine synthase [Gammaproteobacteria bacterium 45_16_T64]
MQPQDDPFIVPECKEEIVILYQDKEILLINKPTGLLSLSGKHPLNKDSVHYRLVKDFPTATIVHRLDFGTSGIMIVALNKVANGIITKQFQARTITKTYTAVLYGLVENKNGIIDVPIIKDSENFPLQKVCFTDGKPALTHYQVVTRSKDLMSTRVLFSPITGRTHQLRIHSMQFGHPILGCDLYASDIAFSMSDRLMLHATSIDFDHPTTGERVFGQCPCPF